MRATFSGLLGSLAVALTGCAHYEAKPLVPRDAVAAWDHRSLDAPELRHFLEQNLHREFTEWPPRSWDFGTLTLVALFYHPSLDVARAQWAVAQSGVATAGGRPNPVLSVTPGYSANPGDVSPWFPSVTLDVPIETAGKRGYRIALAQQLSEVARLNLFTAAWQVRSQLRGVLMELHFADRRVDALQRQLALQNQLLALLEQRLTAGAVAATEVTPARIARLKTVADLADARRLLAEARVRLGEALGVPSRAATSLTLAPEPPFSEASAAALLTDEARDRALQTRPDVLAALAEYAASESALQLEIAKQYPDVHLSPGYQFDQGQHKWSLGLSVELPVLNRNQGPIAEARAKREETAARFLALQAKVIGEIDRAVQAHASVRDQLQNSENLLAAQRQQATRLQGAFQAGAADRFEVDSAQLEAAVAELIVLDAQNRAQQTLGQLEDALQNPFDALRSVEQGRSEQALKETKP